jgi:hypothetical protein
VKAPVTGQTPFASFDLTKTFVAALAVKPAQARRPLLDDPLVEEQRRSVVLSTRRAPGRVPECPLCGATQPTLA